MNKPSTNQVVLEALQELLDPFKPPEKEGGTKKRKLPAPQLDWSTALTLVRLVSKADVTSHALQLEMVLDELATCAKETLQTQAAEWLNAEIDRAKVQIEGRSVVDAVVRPQKPLLEPGTGDEVFKTLSWEDGLHPLRRP